MRQERVQSAVLIPGVADVRAAAQETTVTNLHGISWPDDKHRACLWTATAGFTTFVIGRSRGGSAVEGLLRATFGGVVSSDRCLGP
jgi:hypothetical protein